jgi:predicted PurR-regulated permease PerM
MLIEIFVIPQKIDWQIAQGNRQLATAYRFTRNIRQYVSITSLLGLAGGAVLSIMLVILGVQFAMMWGILFFIMNFVPMVGFWVAVIPPVLLALVQGNPTDAIVIFLAYIIVNFLVNQVFKPALMRGGLDLSPLWSIMSLVVWSSILGPLGLVLGVPLTIALKELILENDEDGRWVADILSARVPTPLGLEEADEKAADEEEDT